MIDSLRLNSADSVLIINDLIESLIKYKNTYLVVNISKKIIHIGFEYMKTKYYDEIRILCAYPTCIHILKKMKSSELFFDNAHDLIESFSKNLDAFSSLDPNF